MSIEAVLVIAIIAFTIIYFVVPLVVGTVARYRGKHLVIFSYFDQGRWLAAPLITGKNSTGLLTFTPDATREEAERIVRGLNNVAKKLEQKESWPWNTDR